MYPRRGEYLSPLSGHELKLISSYFIRKAGRWSLPDLFTIPWRWQHIFNTIYELLSLEEYNLGMGRILNGTLN